MHSPGCKAETLIKNLLNSMPTHLIRMPICNQEAKYNYQTSAAFVKAFIAAM